MSLTVDLQPPPNTVLTDAANVVLVLNATTATANFAVATVSLDASSPAVALTLDAEVDEIVTESMTAGGITVDAIPSTASELAPGSPTVIVLDIDGCFGPPGAQGPPGDPGTAELRWHQAVAASVWDIPHGLGFYPSVSTTDTAGTQVYGNVLYVDENTVQVSFGLAFAGYANLS